jgi:serine/threonine-protein kinase
MSPEQARGSAVDKRTDIWAFGAVLYEMLSGKAAFPGETTSDTLAAVLRAEPDWSMLPAATPARIRKLLRRCLERDRKQRLRDIGEARIVIDEPDEEAAVQRPRRQWPWLLAGALAIALVGGIVSWRRAVQPSPPGHAMRLSIELSPEMAIAKGSTQGVLAISPDGGRLVFATRGADGVLRLATRLLDQSRSTPLAGTENAQGPFFSPNSDWIGFFADGKLKKISVQGGAPVTLCVAPGPRGASWGDDDNIIAALLLGNAGLSRVAAAGGTPIPVTEVNRAKDYIERWPQVLPGSQAVLFNGYHMGENAENASIAVLSFKTGQEKTVERGYFARYLRSGYLVFLRQNTLFAARSTLTGWRSQQRPSRCSMISADWHTRAPETLHPDISTLRRLEPSFTWPGRRDPSERSSGSNTVEICNHSARSLASITNHASPPTAIAWRLPRQRNTE